MVFAIICLCIKDFQGNIQFNNLYTLYSPYTSYNTYALYNTYNKQNFLIFNDANYMSFSLSMIFISIMVNFIKLFALVKTVGLLSNL